MSCYDPAISKSAKKDLENLPAEAKHRLVDVISDVACNRKPTDHEKCNVLSNNQKETVYKIKSGEYRAIAVLEKPEFLVLMVGKRQGMYRDVNEVYAQL